MLPGLASRKAGGREGEAKGGAPGAQRARYGHTPGGAGWPVPLTSKWLPGQDSNLRPSD